MSKFRKLPLINKLKIAVLEMARYTIGSDGQNMICPSDIQQGGLTDGINQTRTKEACNVLFNLQS